MKLGFSNWYLLDNVTLCNMQTITSSLPVVVFRQLLTIVHSLLGEHFRQREHAKPERFVTFLQNLHRNCLVNQVVSDEIVDCHHRAKMREEDFKYWMNRGQLTPSCHGKSLHNHVSFENMGVYL